MGRYASSVFVVLALMLFLRSTPYGAPPPVVADAMVEAATAFLASLDAPQKSKAAFAFDDANRFDFHFIPKARQGVPLKGLQPAQRDRAHALLKTGLGMRGYTTATTIIDLENVLKAIEPPRTGPNAIVRDPELYYVSVFGTPSSSNPWGWRFEGHHISVNFTVAGGRPVAWAPLFFGANPAVVKSGPKQGTRALAEEEEKARALMLALDAGQRAKATIQADAPRDIITMASQQVSPLSPVGLAMKDMTAAQKQALRALLDVYLARVEPDLGKARLERLQQAGLDAITFAWAGVTEVGGPHYYRVQGPTFLIEYDNTQNDNNHIHSVWRDFEGDFGRDILREHYKTTPH
ncbi:MAG: DUF3500 domain-containing protein [Acidobacteria bacterium]|nr:DUF3500 domain-containing protein [Acidobacteriota bacterium]